MSVINKMLRDLDKRQAAVSLPASSERALKYTPYRGRYVLWITLLLGIVGLGVWLKLSAPVVPENITMTEPVSTETVNPTEYKTEDVSPPAEDISAQLAADTNHILTAIDADKTVVEEPILSAYTEPLAPQDIAVLAESEPEPEPVKVHEVKPQLKIERLPETPQQIMQRLKQQAVTAQQNGNFTTAVESWQGILKMAPDNAEGWLGLAQAWQLQGQNQTAYNILLQALQQGVSDASVHLQLAQFAVQQQNWQQAADFLTVDFNILAVPEYYGLRATVQQQLGQHQQALQGFQALLQLQPQQGRWWLGAALSLEAMAQPEQARQYYRQALQWSSNLSAASRHFIQQRLTEAE